MPPQLFEGFALLEELIPKLVSIVIRISSSRTVSPSEQLRRHAVCLMRPLDSRTSW